MAKDGGKKGVIDKFDNTKLEHLLNLLGVDKTAKKIGVSAQGLYKNLEKRGYRTKTFYILPTKEGE